jgi:glycosyltransferase involved in cell wall biosynthesis
MAENFKKEFYTLNYNKPTIGLVMIVKNESKRIEVSLKSVLGIVDALIIHDTGSEDDTIEIIKKFSEKNKINLYILFGEFVNFSESRNKCLEFAETVDVHYFLLFDCNDELQNGKELKTFAKQVYNKKEVGFLICQHWYSGKNDRYFNIKFIKARKGWRYEGVVHEWLVNNQGLKNEIFKCLKDITIYQDRTKDDDKSKKRFSRDKILLLEEYKKNPKCSRTIFYLAQTLECLNEYEECLFFSKLRLELGDFEEEIFHSYMRCATCCYVLRNDWSEVMSWYLKAYEKFNRVEPLIKIAGYYRIQKNWNMAYMFCKQACELEYPQDALLFVDNMVYEYYRWHLMGIICFYLKKYEEGKKCCIKALEKNIDIELNKKNLQFYLDIEIQNKITELRKMFPNMTEKSLEKKAEKIIIKNNQQKNLLV